ncbi:S26 Type I signal peptidase [Encephalitozoon romaleae SJ-2008]|uniref:Signal peptidase complex catalytic subunit SEC11 n=1 Tax=Encephalitozoon romaleae (strain SJ-2008) TaxID=1178016 RepID=I6ZH70_ENCRO|nr:S26 Type I signal peptidase [Encephalitozoon romaleae SJ-2008]AFN82543.1 S26 Type I signal peptidase [Encephalitozoon romaleae SJ-2008]
MLEYIISEKDIRMLKRMSIRQKLVQFVNAAYSVMGTYMIWKMFSILLNNDSPIVVVLSESMSPGFERGDILWLANKDFSVGDMTVFKFGKEIPCVHRCIKQFGGRYLTKGDNNLDDDVSLYPKGRNYLTRNEVKSIVVGYIPYFGWINLWINTIPGVKFAILAAVGLSVLFTREE